MQKRMDRRRDAVRVPCRPFEPFVGGPCFGGPGRIPVQFPNILPAAVAFCDAGCPNYFSLGGWSKKEQEATEETESRLACPSCFLTKTWRPVGR
jgi:hypothetical protein